MGCCGNLPAPRNRILVETHPRECPVQPARDPFERPTLHLVIAEDSPFWADRIEASICEPIRQWGLCRTGQFKFVTHRCASVQAFQKTIEPLVGSGELVYATL